MSKNLIGGIVFAIIGLIILLTCIFAAPSIAVSTVGGLFLGAGIIWIVLELTGKMK